MTHFSLITLNCLGVPGPRARSRLLTLASALNQRALDLVCLQEVQAHSYRRLLIGACTDYPYAAFEPFVHAPKGGLLTLARLPLVETEFTLYRDRGDWYTPALMDWILHKGVLSTRLLIEEQAIVVLNTHLSANYPGDWASDNRFVRAERGQLRQLAEIVVAQPCEALVIVVGDFNVPRSSGLFTEFLAASGLSDTLAGDIRPTYRPRRGIPARYALPIDFVLLRVPRHLQLRAAGDLCFQERLPLLNGEQAYLSDHCGIELRLEWGFL